MKQAYLFSFIVLIIGLPLKAQIELQKVAPLSPDAAAITKYGEIPVSYFTGIPGISVPIHTIKSRSLSLPLSLNYHAGGIKVEENASWVGLGWSLGTIPTITRQVNGIPDESGLGGYYRTQTYDGLTMKEMEDSFMYTPDEYWVNVFRKSIYFGDLDPEADLYFYSLPGKSGKFWWNQDLNKFQVYPQSGLKVEWFGSHFMITDTDGTVYMFYDYETSQSSNTSSGPTIKNAWYVSTMYDANKTDSINFVYNGSSTLSYSLAPYIYPLFGTCYGAPDLTVTNIGYIKILDSIWFNNGYVKFIVQNSSRLDFNGGYALDSIRLYDKSSNLLNQFKLKYHYLESSDGSPLCAIAQSYEQKRLMLDEVEQLDNSNVHIAKHKFLYDSTIAAPCKLSTAQDLWGFYNGKTSNEDLTPRTVVNNAYNGILIGGNADRVSDPNYTQFGVLKRIAYPTGGYTDFEYENNTAINTSIPIAFATYSVALQGEAPGPITTTIYTDTFLVDNPPNVQLNGNLGGAFLNAEIGAYGCDLSGGSSPCASFTIHGIDPGNSSVFGTVLPNNTVNWYVPNGQYVMTASFNQAVPDYDEFWFSISWLGIDQSTLNAYNRYVGGLRIKDIRSFDRFGNNTTRHYKYTLSQATDSSSGGIFGSPHTVTDHVFERLVGLGPATDYCLSLQAHPNAISVQHAGSYIGYGRVNEFTDTAGTQGMTEYIFTTAVEGIVPISPYPPPESQEYARGLPAFVGHYGFRNGSYYPTRFTHSEYLLKSYDSLRSVSYKLYCRSAGFDVQPALYGEWDDDFYYLTPTWSGLSKQTEIIYDQHDPSRTLTTVTDYKYSSDNQLQETSFINSKGDTIKSRLYYPGDLSLSGDAETARQKLVMQNNISAVLKQETYNNSTLTGETRRNYKVFNTGGVVMPEELFQKTGSGSSESRLKFLRYDVHGNLISQQKTDDVKHTYVWDYSSEYPVAEVLGSDSASVAFTSFEADSKGGWSFSSSASGTYSITGSKSYLVSSGQITRSSLASGTYIVSYWGRTGSVSVNSAGPTRTGKTIGDWTYYEHEVTGTGITITGSYYIDELRLYPKGSQMNSFTFTPLVGMTSHSDVNGRIIYYQYDSANRLALIKDEEGKILKRIEYKYGATYNQ